MTQIPSHNQASTQTSPSRYFLRSRLLTLDGLTSPLSRAELKVGVHMKAVFWLVIMALTQISRSRFKQSRISMLIQLIYVLGRFVNFWVIFTVRTLEP